MAKGMVMLAALAISACAHAPPRCEVVVVRLAPNKDAGRHDVVQTLCDGKPIVVSKSSGVVAKKLRVLIEGKAIEEIIADHKARSEAESQ
jgi:hypothetical protein